MVGTKKKKYKHEHVLNEMDADFQYSNEIIDFILNFMLVAFLFLSHNPFHQAFTEFIHLFF